MKERKSSKVLIHNTQLLVAQECLMDILHLPQEKGKEEKLKPWGVINKRENELILWSRKQHPSAFTRRKWHKQLKFSALQINPPWFITIKQIIES